MAKQEQGLDDLRAEADSFCGYPGNISDINKNTRVTANKKTIWLALSTAVITLLF